MTTLELVKPMTDQEAAYYYLLEYLAQTDPLSHFRGVRANDGEFIDYWPHFVQAIEDGRLAEPEPVELAA